jgi:hypothetical protein
MIAVKEVENEKINPFKPKNGPSSTHPRTRKGKTAKDRAKHAHSKNAENKDLRASWRNSGNGKRTLQSFPWSSCNGKKNRYQITGKGGKIVYLR